MIYESCSAQDPEGPDGSKVKKNHDEGIEGSTKDINLKKQKTPNSSIAVLTATSSGVSGVFKTVRRRAEILGLQHADLGERKKMGRAGWQKQGDNGDNVTRVAYVLVGETYSFY